MEASFMRRIRSKSMRHEIRNPKSEIRNPKAEPRTPNTDGRRPKSEPRRPKSEGRNPKHEIRIPESGGGCHSLFSRRWEMISEFGFRGAGFRVLGQPLRLSL